MKTPACIIAAALVATAASPAYAARPLTTDDPGPVPLHKWQIELGGTYIKQDPIHHGDFSATLTYGIIDNVEIQVGAGWQYEHHPADDEDPGDQSGATDVSFESKWQFATQEKAFLDLGLAGTVTIPTADHDIGLGDGKPTFDVTLLAQRNLDDRTAVLFNVGYTYIVHHTDENSSSLIHYGPALTYQLTPQFQPVIEYVVFNPVESGEPSSGANLGFRYQLTDGLILDAAAGTKVSGDWPVLSVTMGLTWVF